MNVRALELVDFRNYASASVVFADGVTVLSGDNGQGKTSLVEAIAYLSTTRSFRGVAAEALIRSGAGSAILRATVVHVDGRESLLEAEISREGRNRIQVNRKRPRRTRDLLEHLRTTVFSPEDLELVKGSPQHRRDYLDAVLDSVDAQSADELADLDKVLRQRNALLKQAGGRLSGAVAATLDVWDERLAVVGERVAAARRRLLDRLAPVVTEAYRDLAGRDDGVSLGYESSWPPGGLAEAVAAAREDDFRRAVTTVGPRPRGHHGRSAPRRRGGRHPRLARAHPRLAGRAADARTRDAAGGAPVRDAALRTPSRTHPRRRALRTRPLPRRGAAAPRAAGTDAHHDGRVSPGWNGAGARASDQRRDGGGGMSGAAGGTSGEGRLFDEINRLVARLGGQSAAGVAGVFSDWAAIVGDDVARNVTPVKLVDGRLVVSVADPAWATQVRFLEADIISAIVAATPVRVTGVDVRVVRHPRRP